MITAPFDWRSAIGFGLGVLRLPPETFWRMTPRELALAIEAVTGRPAATIERSALVGLMQRYPDSRTDGLRSRTAGADHG
jgi:uncharacterized phage protein (TIGR02216 family)